MLVAANGQFAQSAEPSERIRAVSGRQRIHLRGQNPALAATTKATRWSSTVGVLLRRRSTHLQEKLAIAAEQILGRLLVEEEQQMWEQ